ncbi:hypothetical protein [Oricola sp.]|uniref:hypothetical protein n=1 Tax=Oricola sp. TaxID=1979950 RepID=UPI0035140068
MASQWGRDSEVQSGKSGGRGLSLFAVLIAFALGLAGGYGVLRFLGQGEGTAIVDAQRAADALERENDRLKSELETSQRALAEREAAGDGRQAERIDALTQELAAVTAEKDQALAKTEEQSGEIRALNDRIAALTDSASSAENEIAAELARLRDEVLPGLIAERDRLAGEAEAAKVRIEELTGEIAALTDDKAAGAARIAELEGALDAARHEIAVLEAETTGTGAKKPGETGEASAEGGDALPTPRDAQAVEAALRDAPGLDALAPADRQTLKDALISGACVTTALEGVFDDVPILALRNLIRDLKSGC